MDRRDREVSAPKRGRALIASVFIAVSMVASSGALHRLSGPALAAAKPPPSNGDTSCPRGCPPPTNKTIPPHIPTKGFPINEPKVGSIPHFTITVLPPKPANKKTSITSGDVVHVTVTNSKTFTISVTTSKGKPITSWSTPLEVTPPAGKGGTYVLKQVVGNTLVAVPFVNGRYQVTSAGVYQWVFVPTPPKKHK
jgi:hypothetical protein